MQQESKSSLRFRHWVRANGKRLMSGSYEVKDSRGKNYLSFKEIKEEQINHALANQSERGNLIRISSGTVGGADYNFFRKSTAWFVIFYPEVFHVISVENFLFERDRSTNKSLTEQRARAIATISVPLSTG